MSMSCKCPSCGHGKAKVVRSEPGHNCVIRRRQCALCRCRYITKEQLSRIESEGVIVLFVDSVSSFASTLAG